MTATPSNFHYRQCCNDGPANGVQAFIEPIGDRSIGIGSVVSVASVEDEKPVVRVAYHEAAHSVVGFAVGLEVGEVVARNGGHAVVTGGADRDWPNLLMIAAGDFGGDLPRRWTYRPADEDLVPWIEAVRSCRMGFCDRCRIIRALISRTGHGPDKVILDEYRRLETDVIDMLDQPKIKSAIHALAHELMKNGRLSGDQTNEILQKHLERN